jgi:dTDP-4-amino-4,6-dideoxygalactose transaminase
MDKLALFGGSPVKKSAFPTWPQYDERERRALLGVLDSEVWWRTPGTQTLKFEQEVGPGDEVIVPNFTFVATASAVLSAGALPVLVDVTPDTFCLDPDLAEAAITERTKAIVVVHMGGHPADLDRFLEICRKRHLYLLEDSAHAHGSEWRGQKIGALGDIGTFSFQQTKLMTAGEGGVIITNDDDLERLARSVHDCGRMPDEWFYAHFIYGSNYRLSEWQGAVLRQQLSRFDDQMVKRNRNAAYLNSALVEIEGITPQRRDPRCTCNGHYSI